MNTLSMAPGVYWTGVLDPDLRIFDVIMKADHGTTYNSYLVKGDKGCALIETAKEKFRDQYFQKVFSLVDPSQITHVILNHTEPDHTGSLGALLEQVPSATLVSSKNAVPFIKAILNRDVEVLTVGDGDTIDLGGVTLEFFQTPFLHWPDTMFTFVRERGILFPCDFLGSHFADERMFDDEVDDFTLARRHYFDHIIRPFKEYVLKALDKIKDLPVKMIAPSHGPILRTNLDKYIEDYRQWSLAPAKGEKPYAMVFYLTSYGNTKQMAEEVAKGAREAGADVGVFDLQAADIPAIVDEVERADAIATGSLTINGDAVKPVWDLLSSLATLKIRGKSAVAFGSYGWSGEAVRFMEERLKGLKFKVPAEGVRAQLFPTEADLNACRELGRKLVGSLSA
ncbi:MAG: FprA family A-type flavoprotein [Proteobacteria bacterium]|nr:FprA family A-type flavoprotein [Pseudomonadota bacterium]